MSIMNLHYTQHCHALVLYIYSNVNTHYRFVMKVYKSWNPTYNQSSDDKIDQTLTNIMIILMCYIRC